MASNAYHFITHWRVPGTLQEVNDILSNAADLPRWWPSVYLDVQVLEPGDERGLGRVASLYTKGWLPYTLRWQFRVTRVSDDGFALVAWGDFDGRGIWTFKQEEHWVNIMYDWKINAEKPLLRNFSFLLKPIFAANHRWAMARGEESLRLELARRRASNRDELERIPAPPAGGDNYLALPPAGRICRAFSYLQQPLLHWDSLFAFQTTSLVLDQASFLYLLFSSARYFCMERGKSTVMLFPLCVIPMFLLSLKGGLKVHRARY